MAVEVERLETILEPYTDQGDALIKALMEVQAEYNWLPEEALTLTAERLTVPLSNVLRVATFYKAFSLEPRG
ncbi:MAG: NAD(P)H-dependent oxidoreductase subunit E, partial [Armatimonadota bacterium]